MSEMTAKEKSTSFWMSAKVKIVGLGAAGMGLVASASASTDINASVGPILDSVTAMVPSIIALVVGIVPAIIVLAVVGFITGFFDSIISKIRL